MTMGRRRNNRPAMGRRASASWRALFKHDADNMPYSDVGVTAAACPCAETGTIVRVLRSQTAMKVGVQRLTALNWSGDGSTWSSAAAAAMTATPTQIATLTTAITGESTPAVAKLGTTMRLFYGDGGRFYSALSTNDGSTWGAPTSLWNLNATYNRLTNLAACSTGSGAQWLTAFNGITPAGDMRVRGIGNPSGQWTEMPDSAGIGWQVAGVQMGSPFEPDPCAYVYLWGKTGGYSCLACQRVKLNSNGTFNSWDGEPKIVDTAGWTGIDNYERVRLGDAACGQLFTLREESGQDWLAAQLCGVPGSLEVRTPVVVDTEGSAATAEYLTPVQAGGRSWLMGAGAVYLLR